MKVKTVHDFLQIIDTWYKSVKNARVYLWRGKYNFCSPHIQIAEDAHCCSHTLFYDLFNCCISITVVHAGFMEGNINRINLYGSVMYHVDSENITFSLLKKLRQRCSFLIDVIVVFLRKKLFGLRFYFVKFFFMIRLPFSGGCPVGLHNLAFFSMAQPRIKQRFTHFYFHCKYLLYKGRL